MDALKALDSYNDLQNSAIEWLGDIPSHWQLKRLKYVVEIVKRIAGKEGINVLSITQKGIKVKDIDSGEGQLAMDYSKYQLLYKGEFAMNHMDLLTGYVDISKYDGVVSPDYRAFRNRSPEVLDAYLLLIFQMGYTQRIFYKYGQGVSFLGRWRFPADNFNNFYIPIPPLDEQEKIVAFLSRKTARIDEAIATKEKQISLLKERSQIILQKSVTQGLNSDVPMNDSGVNWIGLIPEHWELKKFKYVLKQNNKKLLSKKSNLRYIGMESVESKSGKLSGKDSEAEGLATRFYSQQILFGKLRPYLAKVYLADMDGMCSTEFLVFSASEEINCKFAANLLLSNGFINTVDASTYGSKMPRASADFIGNMLVAIPPVNEQVKICAYIDEADSYISKLIRSEIRQIEKLKEYKTTLINSAVTGKIKVA